MWSRLQLSVVWVGMQLVSVAAATCTTTCEKAVMVRFRQPKTSSGQALCVADPAPSETVTKSNKNECSRECAGRGAMCAGGFNYKHREELCELFAGSPTTFVFQLQHDCESYMVCIYDVCQITSYFDF